MRILLITRTDKYSYHKNLAEDISKVLSDVGNDIEIYDLNDSQAGFIHYANIKAKSPQLLITLDCAGFDILTSGGTLAYNGLTCKCIHILLQGVDIYKNELKHRQNISMYTLVSDSNEIDRVSERFTAIPNLRNYSKIDYKSSNDAERESNRVIIKESLSKLMEEIKLLNESVEMPSSTEGGDYSERENESEKNILIFEWGTGSITFEDVFAAFKREGYSCKVISYNFEDVNNDTYFENIFSRELASDNYQFVYSTNFFPLVAKCCDTYNVKYISWSYDAPLDVPKLEETLGYKNNKVYLYDRMMVQEYNAKGFNNVYHLPLAVNTDRIDKIKITDNDIKKYSADISFVGKLYESQLPLIMNAIDEYHKGFLEAVIKAQSKIYGYYLIDDVLTDEFMTEINRNSKINIPKEALSYALAAQITREERLLFLKLLSNHYDVKLYSAENNELLSNATFMGTVGYMNEMPKVFKLSKINLNMSLRCIKSGIPLRALDIMGAGGFLMSNYQPEIAEYFIDGEDYVMYESVEDMYAKVDYYLKNDELRQAIAKNGHDKVKALFDYDSRIKEMI